MTASPAIPWLIGSAAVLTLALAAAFAWPYLAPLARRRIARAEERDALADLEDVHDTRAPEPRATAGQDPARALPAQLAPIGFLAGALIGFLTRPSIPLAGRPPIREIVEYVKEGDEVAKALAIDTVTHIGVSAIVGLVLAIALGLVVRSILFRRASPA